MTMEKILSEVNSDLEDIHRITPDMIDNVVSDIRSKKKTILSFPSTRTVSDGQQCLTFTT